MVKMTSKLKVLELFCGTKSISKAFEKAGHETFTIDNDPQHNPSLCINILDFEIKMLPKEWRKPDIIWASPPCTTFSVASIYRYWENRLPKSYKTYIGMAIAKKTVELIKELNPKYYFIENPVGMMRKQHFMDNLPRKTLTYCKYGKRYRKATDIWTNASHWIPKKTCKPGDLCHEEARRGMNRGVQRDLPGWALWEFRDENGNQLTTDQLKILKGSIPEKLSKEIVKVCEGNLKIKQDSLTGWDFKSSDIDTLTEEVEATLQK